MPYWKDQEGGTLSPGMRVVKSFLRELLQEDMRDRTVEFSDFGHLET